MPAGDEQDRQRVGPGAGDPEECELTADDLGLPVVVLRVTRFFPEPDDRDDVRAAFSANLKVNEYLHRRVDIADVVDAP